MNGSTKVLYEEFVEGLSRLFGHFDHEARRFGKASNSEIARELGYSDAQFSRLINESATEGEYQRAIQNVNRILTVQNLERKLRSAAGSTHWSRSKIWFFATIFLVFAIALLSPFFFRFRESEEKGKIHPRESMLKWAFESSFINSYQKLNDMPDDCDFPCYKYQGKWVLDHSYKLPFFRERNGFHYLATEVAMYSRCMYEADEYGRLMEGFEYQQHEIWYDRRELPIDSFMQIGSRSVMKEDYQKMDFSKDPNFIKLATVHTFFRNEFRLDSGRMVRSGKVLGRDLEFVASTDLEAVFESDKMIQDIRNELNRIATNRLEDFSRPISCEDGMLPRKDFHEVTEGDRLTFECQLTTGRVPMDYVKTYVLMGQFIRNKCVPSD